MGKITRERRMENLNGWELIVSGFEITPCEKKMIKRIGNFFLFLRKLKM